MQTLTLPPMDVITSAAAELAQQARSEGNRAGENAINRAELQLRAGVTPIPTSGGFLVESRSTSGTAYRVSSVHGCGCQAGQAGRPCWHQAVITILEECGKRTLPALPQRLTAARAARVAKADADMAELFN